MAAVCPTHILGPQAKGKNAFCFDTFEPLQKICGLNSTASSPQNSGSWCTCRMGMMASAPAGIKDFSLAFYCQFGYMDERTTAQVIKSKWSLDQRSRTTCIPYYIINRNSIVLVFIFGGSVWVMGWQKQADWQESVQCKTIKLEHSVTHNK